MLKVGVAVVRFSEVKGLLSIDLTGRFPFTLVRGNAYLAIIYDQNSNMILAKPMKNRGMTSWVKSCTGAYHDLPPAGTFSDLLRMDNKTSAKVFAAIANAGMMMQLTSPVNHRGFTERVVKAFKNKCLFKSYMSVTQGCQQTNGTDY